MIYKLHGLTDEEIAIVEGPLLSHVRSGVEGAVEGHSKSD